MATSGYNDVYVTNWDTLRFSWSVSSTSLENNSDTVTWSLLLIATKYGAINSEVGAIKPWSVTVNGVTYSGKNSIDISNNVTKTLASGSTVIVHDNDGTKKFTYSFSQYFGVNFSNTNIQYVTGQSSGQLDTIFRKATLTAAPDFTDVQNPTITYSNPAGNSITSLKACISLTGSKDDITYRDISKTGTNYTFNLTETERNVLRNNTLNGTDYRNVTFFIKTEINGTIFYSTSTKKFTVSDCSPTLDPVVEDYGIVSYQLTGNRNTIIKGCNYPKLKFNASAKKGASIISKSVTCGGIQYTVDTSNSGWDGYFTNVDSNSFIFSVTDNRGKTTNTTITKTLKDYSKFTFKISPTASITQNNEVDVNIKIDGTFFNQSFGDVNNELSVDYKYLINDLESTSSTVSSKNIFNPANVIESSLVKTAQGMTTSTTYDTSGYIPVEQGKWYYIYPATVNPGNTKFKFGNAGYFKDDGNGNKVYIPVDETNTDSWAVNTRDSDGNPTSYKVANPFTPPPDAEYFVISFTKTNTDEVKASHMVYELDSRDSTKPTSYIPYTETTSVQDWAPLSVTTDSNKFSIDHDLLSSTTGLMYTDMFVLQIRIKDKITNYIYDEKRLMIKPTFDWGKDDFNFNVSVHAPAISTESMSVNGVVIGGGELIGCGCIYKNVATSTFTSGNLYGFSDISGDDYYTDTTLMDFNSGTFRVFPKNIVGIIEVDVSICGHNDTGCYGIWWHGNKNTLITGIRLLGVNSNNRGKTIKALGKNPSSASSYSGASEKYIYVIDKNTVFNNSDCIYINPMFEPYGGNFVPNSSGTTSIMSVKLYSKRGI